MYASVSEIHIKLQETNQTTTNTCTKNTVDMENITCDKTAVFPSVLKSTNQSKKTEQDGRATR